MAKQTIMLAPLFWLASIQAATAADWAAYESENFTLYSDASTSEAERAVENFELFRQVTLTTLNLPEAGTRDRLLIIMLDRLRDYNRLKPRGNVAGFFYDSIFGPRAIVGPNGGTETTQLVLFHEYVHYLMNHSSQFNYPRWYSEGLATLLATADIGDESIVIGRPAREYGLAISVGRGVSVGDVIDTRFDGPAADFYLTSWLMTHYFLIEPRNATTRRPQTLDYLRRYDAGEDPVEAFSESYGTSPQEMRLELASYLRKRVWTGISLPRPERIDPVSRRQLDDDEVFFRLGDIAVELDKYEAAHEYFDRFEALDAESRFRSNVTSRRAIAYIHEGRTEEGDRLMEPLLATDTADADVLADVAHYAYDRFVKERKDGAQAATSYLLRSIEYGGRAVELNPADLEALYYLGLAYEANGDLQLAADMLLMGFALNASAPRLNLSLARVLLKGRQPRVASYLISRVYSHTHSEEGRARLRDLQRQIEEGTVDPDQIDELL